MSGIIQGQIIGSDGMVFPLGTVVDKQFIETVNLKLSVEEEVDIGIDIEEEVNVAVNICEE